MSIVFQNSKKNLIKVNDAEIVKKVFFLHTRLKYTNQIDIFGVHTYVFKEKEDFKIFREFYEIEVHHIEFMKKYESGGFDHLFDENGKLKPFDQK